ncbi:MAG: hypothetical protein AAF612_07805 [Planctomycetota bacterium]
MLAPPSNRGVVAQAATASSWERAAPAGLPAQSLPKLQLRGLATAPVHMPGLFLAVLLAGSLDLLLTLNVLSKGFVEANPAAEWVWLRWGGAGLTGLKYLTLAVFFVACHALSQLEPARARAVGWTALYLAVTPVAWTAGMLLGQALPG